MRYIVAYQVNNTDSFSEDLLLDIFPDGSKIDGTGWLRDFPNITVSDFILSEDYEYDQLTHTNMTEFKKRYGDHWRYP